MNLQKKAVESVKRRGFWESPHCAVSYDNFRMWRFLTDVAALGQEAREWRKTKPGGMVKLSKDHDNHKLALQNAQLLRLVEEVGELADSVLAGGMAEYELADVLIVLCQIAELAGVDLETVVLAKLKADEQRGHLHGERTEVAA